VIPDSQTAQNWEQLRARVLQPARSTVEKFTTQPNTPPVSAVTMSMKMANVLFEGEKFDASTLVSKNEAGETVPAFELNSSKRVAVTIAIKAERPMTQNVVAVWEGGDPVLKNEYVAVGAHYDHVGICAPGQADQICNGADDDGSGTTALLGMAEAISHARQKPKRSVLFVWHLRRRERTVGFALFHRLSHHSFRQSRDTTEHRHDRPQQKSRRHQRA
jgi:Zn-dependent M28 family amino/carboxypeptidase